MGKQKINIRVSFFDEKSLNIHCGTPMVGTLLFFGSEFYCVGCGESQGVLGSAEIVPWTKQLGEKWNLNQIVFRKISSACIPPGSRFPNCEKCAGQDHLFHASNLELDKSAAAYKLLAGGILEEDETNVSS